MFRQISDYLDDRRRQRNREAAFVMGGCAVLFLIVAGVVGIVVSIFNAVERGNVNQTYGTFASACDPSPIGQDDPANLPNDTTTPRQLLLLIDDTQRRARWHGDMPDAWRAENEAEVGLVGCVTETWVPVETCSYRRNSTGSADGEFTINIEREQHQMAVVLINPTTNQRIDSLSLTGGDPLPCPADEDVSGSGSQRGQELFVSDAADWLESYVFEN